MRRTRWLPVVRAVLAGTVLFATGIAAAKPSGTIDAGPHFAGYPTKNALDAPRFDFARLDAAPAREVQEIAGALAGLPPLAQLTAVNARINRVPFRDDWSNYGVADHWATPREFFRRGGDCE